jgi:hypothetical protein
LLGFFFGPEDGGDTLLRNVGLTPNYTGLEPRSVHCSKLNISCYHIYIFTKIIVDLNILPCSISKSSSLLGKEMKVAGYFIPYNEQ